MSIASSRQSGRGRGGLSSIRFAGLLVAGLTSLCATVAGVRAEDAIKIGVITSRTGVFALYGTAGEQGIRLAADEINKSGGIKGKQIELMLADTNSKPEDAGRLFREQTAQGAFLVIGAVASAESAAASTLAKENKVPFFTTGGYGRFLTEDAGHRYFFRLAMNVRGFYTPLARELAKKPLRKYCTINNDYEFARDLNRSTLAVIREGAPDVSVLDGCEFWVPLGTTDFASYITAIMSKGPEVVLFSGLVGPSARAFLAQAKSFGLFKIVLGAHASMGNPANAAGVREKDIPGNIFTAGDYPYPPVDTPSNMAFFKSYKERWNAMPMSESAAGYTTMKFVAKAIEKAGKLDREAFIMAAEGLDIESPAAGRITVRPFDHQSTQGVWTGNLAWDAKDDRAGMSNIGFVESAEFLPSAEEVAKLRSSPTK
ncbi:ABC transporter substrate-binding protein [Bradyrhizobium sp. Ai1a-2]|uniref:ABC transporter substrate-binding protein n=1 Tax=Bradyrhizobium sp. Ai1a-2 TaxID=196490 RepID=UPI0009FBAED1|nr:ABC transporter substrate-binding protein [Bradyrhizobium sp. Ai1a-2]